MDIRQGWFSKLMAASLLGTLMVIGIIFIITSLCYSHGKSNDLVEQYLLWIGALVWIASFASCFLFRSGKRAWGFYIVINIILWGSFWTIRMFFS